MTSEFLAVRKLPDGRALAVVQMTFGKARLCLGPGDLVTYDIGWCYDDPEVAVSELKRWDPTKEKEPNGWMREPHSGRRRPGGDPKKEYVMP